MADRRSEPAGRLRVTGEADTLSGAAEASGDRGRRRPTMTDVARAAGVSAMTVSYVYSRPGRVSEATAAKVRRAADLRVRRPAGGPFPRRHGRGLRDGARRLDAGPDQGRRRRRRTRRGGR